MGYTELEGHALHGKSLLAGYAAQATEPLDKKAGELADKIEKLVPKHKGRLPKTALDLGFLFVYLLVVTYVFLKVFFFAFWLAKSIFCMFFCCCCRGGSKKPSSAKAAKQAQKRAEAKKAAPTNADAKGSQRAKVSRRRALL